jgi:HD superfamily phosphohydrolase
MTGKITSDARPIADALYGSLTFPAEIAALIFTPVVQRMRHVRLSNIDSIDMPAIANLSRFEHVLGTAHLASQVGFTRSLTDKERRVLIASALLHDWAITAYGHLVEEALQYVGLGFDHEERLREILAGETPEEILGIGRQVLVGRETKLEDWADRVSDSPEESLSLLDDVTDHIRGRGAMGRVIAGQMDVDNIDSVFRLSFHMGLPTDLAAPLRLANAMVRIDRPQGTPLFEPRADGDIRLWQATRRAVYERLMHAPRDFAGKIMLLYATTRALQAREIDKVDWSMTDFQFLTRLLESNLRDVQDAAQRWVAGELWDLTPLRWMEGHRPDYTAVLAFSEQVSTLLARPCLAYAIKDKRERKLTIQFVDGSRVEYGVDAAQWLLGVGSSSRRPFTSAEVATTFALAEEFFRTRTAELEPAFAVSTPEEPWLF